MKKDKIIVAVSGGFDPIHVGHLEMFEHAKKLGDHLVVILNNDNWLIKKKGFVFMPAEQRKTLTEALRCVDEVVITEHGPDPKDMSVAETLAKVRPHIFANGGDRKKGNTPEGQVAKKLNIKMIFNIGGGKTQSSSWLLGDFLNKHT
ncbi:MAG: adenylyltransferase/cytidyltransferase family protein [Candidatus Spechtbacterales bacterium]